MKKYNLEELAEDARLKTKSADLLPGEVQDVLKAAFDTILDRCAEGTHVIVTGFGTFRAKLVKGRKYDPPASSPLDVPGGWKLKFYSAPAADAAVNASMGALEEGMVEGLADEVTEPPVLE